MADKHPPDADSEHELTEFVPKKGKKSEVWKYFGFPKNGRQTDYGQVMCKICKECQPYKSTTTNMRVHLDRKHWSETHQQPLTLPTRAPELATSSSAPPLPTMCSEPEIPAVVKVEPETNRLPGQLGAATVLKRQPSLQNFMASKKPYAMDSARAKNITRALAEFIVTDMRPISTVEGSGFRNLIHTIDPQYKVISRNHLLEKYIVPMYNVACDEVKADIAKAPSHSFTTDAWSSSTMQSFVTTTSHYIDPNTFELRCNVLDTHCVTGQHTGEKLASEMELSEKKWGLKDVKGVSDNAANIQSAFNIHAVPHLGCFAHTINLAVSKGLEESAVKRLLGKARSLVSTFKQSYIRTQDLHEKEKLLDLKELSLIQDVATRWNSVYYMVDRLLAIYPAVYSSLYGSSHEHLLLSDDERKNLEDLLKILKPFEKATKKISSEKEPTGSLILPYLHRFKSQDLSISPSDSSLMKKVKNSIRADLEKRYKKEEQKSLLGLITVLDPRTRSLDWMDEEEKEIVYQALKEECLRLCPQVAQMKTEPESVSVDQGPPEKIPKCVSDSDSDDDLGSVVFVKKECGKTQEELVFDELAKYRDEPSFGTKYKETLNWWKRNEHKYPILTQVMLRYLHVPASSVPSERIFSTAGGVFNKRDTLAPDNADILVFLYHNFVKYKSLILPKWCQI